MILNKKNIISFIQAEGDIHWDPPVPAKSCIPEWYKNTPITTDGKERGIGEDEQLNSTVKSCIPFLDALTLGYIYMLPVDVQIKKREDGSYQVSWLDGGDKLIESHDARQFPKEGAGPRASSNPFKWHFPFIIKTPPGYSSLFTHPLNRNDLPFQTLTGVVDTDQYPIATNFPFMMLENKKDFMIIEKGTPICQIFPFKRESWTREEQPFESKSVRKGIFQLRQYINNAYKKQWWCKKEFK